MPYRGDEAGGPQLALPRITPVVKVLLIVVAVFFAFELFDDHGWIGTHGVLARWCALIPGTVTHGQVWRLLTYWFVNPVGEEVMPVVWSAIAFYFFGPDLEEQLGRASFILFLAITIFLSGVIAITLGAIIPSLAIPIYGLNLPSLALTAAWGSRFPNRRLLFPPVAAKWLVIGIVGIEIVLLIAKARGDAAAAIGSMAVGFLVARYWRHIEGLFDRLQLQRAHGKRARALRAIRGGLDDGKKKRPVDKRSLN